MQIFSWLAIATTCVILQMVGVGLRPAAAGPSAETAKKCIRYSYLLYPYRRPGAVRMSADRNNYFRDCMAKDGNVPEPPALKEPKATTDVSATTSTASLNTVLECEAVIQAWECSRASKIVGDHKDITRRSNHRATGPPPNPRRC